MDDVSHDPDRLTRFLLEAAGVRGVRVHLDQAWREIASRAEYPREVSLLLGQAAVATALLTAHAKVEGRLSLQLRGDQGPLQLLFAECTAAGTLRGIARLEEPGDEGDREVTSDLRDFGAGAILAITIENPSPGGRDPVRYQGLVPLEAPTLAVALEDYFRQSEQLPTRLLLVADGQRAAGVMLQKLPGDEGDDDGWTRASALLDTLAPRELLGWPVATLLHRLFHDEDVRLMDQRPLRFACSCSRERVADVLHSLGEDEARAAAAEGMAEIRCEFCGQRYHFDADAIGALFAAGPDAPAPPPSLQ
ncbi:MAG TPA: Hsp33 family molecular chaperone HslO [Xanthomonadaceae bacterium]|nr:Hsp33 family molecular chaperone HslO [Xanthomonadaceae bacterium]